MTTFLTASDIAAAFRVHITTVRLWVRDGLLVPVAYAGERKRWPLFDRADVQEFTPPAWKAAAKRRGGA